jgi:hypothetical protein
MINKTRIFFLGFLFLLSCERRKAAEVTFNNNDIGRVINKMTELMLHDVTNPPLAARFFSYACLAGYEVVAENDHAYKSMHNVLRDYPSMAIPDSISGYSTDLSALLAMTETAKKMQPSGKLFEGFEEKLLDSCIKRGMDEDVIAASMKYAKMVSTKVLAYAKLDKYNRISNYPRYTPQQKEGYWYPTPPAFFAAVEPYFNTVRPFTLDTCVQFKPDPPVTYSSDKNSPFYKLMLLNYSHPLSDEEKMTAAFWDCNPFAVEDNGHLLVGLKKISPGAHWMGITGIACGSAHKSFEESMQIHTLVAIGLMDAFICCWDEKYRSNRIRPETAIRNLLDPAWQPFLHTPPFPEYLSGHSTVSAASSVILTHFFGDQFSYVDTVEMIYGLPAKKFSSFHSAAKEAAISRFYGGIHFMDAIDNGFTVGEEVGHWVLSKFAK